MGRYSDSEEEKKKRKKKKKKRSRSRSRSSSIESKRSSKLKKSKKSKHKRRSRSRSRSYDKYRRSRSSSRGRRSRSRHRSRSLGRYRSRSRSYSRYSRSRSKDRYHRRSRSLSRGRSRSREKYKRSRDRSKRSRSRSTSRRAERDKSEETEDPFASIPGFSEMPPSEQARIRMQMALKAAAAADEKIKGHSEESRSSLSLQDQMNYSQAIQDIESSGFMASAFKSSRGDKKPDKTIKEEFLFGTAGELKLDPNQRKPVIVNVDTDELAHPNFYTDPEEKMDRWIQKLTTMRRKKLEGEAIS